MKTITPRLIRIFIIAILISAIGVGAAMAASAATLRNYQVDFIEVTGSGQSRFWTYAVTASGDELADMSGWVLSIDSSCGYKFKIPAVLPPVVATYTTPTSYVLQTGPNAGTDICSGTYSCQAATYDVSQSVDSGLHLRSLFINNPTQALSATNPVTHVFRIEIDNLTEHRIGDAQATVDTGTGGSETAPITGAVCPPTAVQLVNLSASSNPASPALFVFLLAAGVVVLAGWVITRRTKNI